MKIMRIKTWINNTVQEFVNKTWPQKTVRCNYNDDSSRMRDENRWIQISSPIDDDYIHYEITYEHIELHFEYSNSKDNGITANAELVDYLEKQTETSNQYVWTDFLGGDSVRCVYIEKIHEWDMLEKLYDVVTFFDKLISDYLTNNQMTISTSKIIVDNSIKAPNSSVELTTYPLEEVFKRNLSIPDYQRIYCWEEKNVKCLLDDLLLHSEQQKSSDSPYRLGTIILHYHDNTYDIIDGQQRLVTLSLILAELGMETCLMEQKFDSSVAIEYIGYNKYLIENFVRKHISERKNFLSNLLHNIELSVLTLNNSSLDLAYTFFSNENSRGVSLTDYDLLKAHHLRFIPETFAQQSRKAAETWNQMIKDGKSKVTEYEPIPDYDRTLDTYLYNLRQWMKMEYHETKDNDRHVKNEYEAAAIMPEIPPFGEQFFFNEPIQGGTHFFSFVEIHLAKYRSFTKTNVYRCIHNRLTGKGSIQWYRNTIETLLFGYYEKFGEHCFADAAILISRVLLQNRYDTSRAQKDSVYKYVSELGIILMINQATSPTFFLADMYNIIRDYPIKYLQEMLPIQRSMRRAIIDIKDELAGNIYVESIRNLKL